MNSNSQEMADAAFTMEAICAAMARRNVTSAPISLAVRWCKEDAALALKKSSAATLPIKREVKNKVGAIGWVRQKIVSPMLALICGRKGVK